MVISMSWNNFPPVEENSTRDGAFFVIYDDVAQFSHRWLQPARLKQLSVLVLGDQLIGKGIDQELTMNS